MDKLQEYKCPSCGGAIAFDSTSQKMKCPFCDTEFEVETLISYDEQLKQDEHKEALWENGPSSLWNEEDGVHSYVCLSCGGEIIMDHTTVATKCPFCDNPVVTMDKLSTPLKPDFVIPFKVNKEQAKQALKDFYKGKTLLPKEFKDENHIEEIKGMYVPFWVFDASINASLRARATRTRFWSDSRYNYTETSYYMVSRKGTMGFENIPVDGSSKIADELMESIEPFDYNEAVDFQTAYLAGYLADVYDVESKECEGRVNERIHHSAESYLMSSVLGYSSVIPEHFNFNLSNDQVKYVLYPVWFLNTSWRGEKYTFIMNGQTGKFAGNLPVDKNAYYKWLVGLTGIISVITFAITYFFKLF